MTLISLEAAWEYQATANTVPPDPFAVTVPAAGWTLGQAPFGTADSYDPTDLPINTAWAVDTGLWIRRNVTTSGLEDVLLQGEVENACYVYVDGEFVGAVNPANTAVAMRSWSVVISRDLLDSGSHEIAILALDESASGAGDDTLIYATADYIPVVLPLQPQAPAKEALVWMTDVMPAEDGTEDRLQVRASPRQRFTYSYPASELERARALNTVYGGRARDWLVPVWPQAQLLGAVAADEVELTAETRYSEFRAGGLVMLWQSTNDFQLLGLDEVVDDATLALAGATREFTAAWLMPVRIGHLVSNPSKALNGHNTVLEMAYEVDDNAALEVAEPTQYLGDDIYFTESLLPGEWLSEDIMTQVDAHDPEIGLTSRRYPWLNVRVGRDHHMMGEGPEEAWEIREWLHRRAGRLRQFWQPSFEMDMMPRSTGTVVSALTVSSDDYRRYSSSRVHIAVEAAGVWYARAISSTVQLDAARVQLNLSAALNVPASSIQRVCFLGLKRLDTDRIEISWPGAGICQSEARMVELSP